MAIVSRVRHLLNRTTVASVDDFVRICHSQSKAAGKMADKVEEAKRKAAYQAIDDWVTPQTKRIGIGSGSTVVYAVERLAQRVKAENLDVVCVPTGFQAQGLIVDNGLKLTSLDQCPELDFCVDGADEVDEDLSLIKGGGACQTQEKIVAACGKTFVVIADFRKKSSVLGQQWKKGVPLEVIPSAYVPVTNKVAQLGGKAKLRMAVNKAGPVVSDNGQFILDADFGEIQDPAALNQQLLNIPGIVETGLFIGMACKAYFGEEDGSVSTREPRDLGKSYEF